MLLSNEGYQYHECGTKNGANDKVMQYMLQKPSKAINSV